MQACASPTSLARRCCRVALNSRAPIAAPERTTFDRYSAARTPRKVAIDRGLLNRFCENNQAAGNVKGGIQVELVIKDNGNCQYIYYVNNTMDAVLTTVRGSLTVPSGFSRSQQWTLLYPTNSSS